MKRICTQMAIFCLLTISVNCFSQTCGTGGSFTAGSTNTFDANVEGFSGDFHWTSGGSGQLESSDAVTGQIKKLKTSTYTFPAIGTTLYWSYNLSGTMNVTSYSVVAWYISGGVLTSIPVCSGGALATTGANLIFNAPAPSQILGKEFQLEITFTSTTTGLGKVLALDNFKVNAFASNSALPVVFASFTAKILSSSVALNWNIGMEQDVNGYEVQRSTDGQNFIKIGFVAATGKPSYSFTDTKPTENSYYRIRSVDANGMFQLSIMVHIKGGQPEVVLKAFPMPVQNKLVLQHGSANSKSRIEISAVDGRLFQTIAPPPGAQETIVELSKAKAGMYFIRFDNGTGDSQTLKIIKQ